MRKEIKPSIHHFFLPIPNRRDSFFAEIVVRSLGEGGNESEGWGKAADGGRRRLLVHRLARSAVAAEETGLPSCGSNCCVLS